jgi:hypothetical protein
MMGWLCNIKTNVSVEDGSSVVLYYVLNIKMFDVHCIQLLVVV